MLKTSPCANIHNFEIKEENREKLIGYFFVTDNKSPVKQFDDRLALGKKLNVVKIKFYFSALEITSKVVTGFSQILELEFEIYFDANLSFAFVRYF